jgi:hypothetical protein
MVLGNRGKPYSVDLRLKYLGNTTSRLCFSLGCSDAVTGVYPISTKQLIDVGRSWTSKVRDMSAYNDVRGPKRARRTLLAELNRSD